MSRNRKHQIAGLVVAAALLAGAALTINYFSTHDNRPHDTVPNADVGMAETHDPARAKSATMPKATETTATANPPEQALVSDVTTLIASLVALAESRDHELARVVALKLRAVAAGKTESILVEVRGALERKYDHPLTELNVLSYLLLAIPPDGFETALTLLRSRWTVAGLTADRAEAIKRIREMPIFIEFCEALPPSDRPLSSAVGFCVADAALANDMARLQALAKLVLAPYASEDGKTEAPDRRTEVPDPWLSAVVRRVSLATRKVREPARPVLFAFLKDIAGGLYFSEHLRHQARILIQEPPANLAELLAALPAAQSSNEAGKLLARYLDSHVLTQDHLLLILAALESSSLSREALFAISTGLEGSSRMKQPGVLHRLAIDALTLIGDDRLSELENSQLCGVAFAAQRVAGLQALNRAASPGAKRALFFSQVDAGVLDAVERVIELCGRADSNLSVARRRILALEAAQLIIELATPQATRVALLRRLVSTAGEASHRMMCSVFRVLLYHHDPFLYDDFQRYASEVLELLLVHRVATVTAAANKWDDEKMAACELVDLLAKLSLQRPELKIAVSARQKLVELCNEVEAIGLQFPKQFGVSDALAAMPTLRASSLLS